MRDAVKEVSKRTKNDGMLDSYYIETGKRTFMWVGVFESEQHLIDSRPALIANLDMMRHSLEEITPELGVTDPASGPVFHVR